MEVITAKLALLLNSKDPAHVAQGLDLAEALADLDVLDELLGESYMVGYSRKPYSDQIFELFNLSGPLNPEAPYAHLCALLLSIQRIELRPDQPHVGESLCKIHVERHEFGLHATRRLVRHTPEIERIDLESSPTFIEMNTLSRWTQAAGWHPQSLRLESEVIEAASQELVQLLVDILQNLPQELWGALIPRLLERATHREVSLVGLKGLTALPDSIDINELDALDISYTAISALPAITYPGPRLRLTGAPLERPPRDAARLSISDDQWRRWEMGLKGLTQLELVIYDDDSDLKGLSRLTDLESLSLEWYIPPPHLSDLLTDLRALPKLRSLALAHSRIHQRTPVVPASLWDMPLTSIKLAGFDLASLPCTPPESLIELCVPLEQLESVPVGWRHLAQTGRVRSVWLLKLGSKKIQVIKTIRKYTERGLKDAKIMSESAPIEVLSTTSTTKSFYLYRELRAAGATATIR